LGEVVATATAVERARARARARKGSCIFLLSRRVEDTGLHLDAHGDDHGTSRFYVFSFNLAT
jgi:hypothetical protein